MTELTHSISDVERDTGLAKETLRVWERRYGFPQPLRDALGERVYPAGQMLKLRLMKRLLDLGHRPGKIVRHDVEALQQLTPDLRQVPDTATGSSADVDDFQEYLALCKGHQIDLLRSRLAQECTRLGLQRFIQELAAPLTYAVGESWARNELAVFEEHLYTESLQIVLRQAIASHTQSGQGVLPRILLTTFPQERHGLGLLMAEAIFAINGAYCISLGVQTPIADIVDAAVAQAADIVALSFSSAMNPRHVVDGLATLRAQLPVATRIWVGGSCPILAKRPLPGVLVLGFKGVTQALIDLRKDDAGAALPA
ncbi:MAG: MerR family transcriptional regulator [Pseudomonadota bacterium]